MSLSRGIERFNRREFFEAHEVWEELWLVAEGGEREFLQGLIQLAAAYHHIQRGTLRGAPRLLTAALRRLATPAALAREVELGDALEIARAHLSALETEALPTPVEYPLLGYNDALS